MKTYNMVKKLALAAVVSSCLALNARAVVNYAFDPLGVDGLNSFAGNNLIGSTTIWTQLFTMNPSPSELGISVSGLGMYGGEIINNVTVGLYYYDTVNSTLGALISSQT